MVEVQALPLANSGGLIICSAVEAGCRRENVLRSICRRKDTTDDRCSDGHSSRRSRPSIGQS